MKGGTVSRYCIQSACRGSEVVFPSLTMASYFSNPVRSSLLTLVIAFAAGAVAHGEVDFEDEIVPIFEENCFDCHGEDKPKGQFRLDRLASLLRGGDSGEAAVVPGDPAASFLVKVIRHKEPELEMPPKGDALAEADIALIEQWIKEGAKTPASYGPAEEKVELTHWSFVPLKRPTSADDVDGFIQAKLHEKGLSLSPGADRHTLIRRLFLVMTGLPPSPERVEAFLADPRPDAWEQLVEEVLASPQYGERMATFWLDLVRFGETNGFETNRERPSAWRYRDWVIASFNQDKRYDEFVLEQIAGDTLGNRLATGFLVAGPYDVVKGRDPKLGIMQRMNELDDIINTTGTAFLGLTTGCARCHNHKFDPISQKDYYAMQAVFAGVQHAETDLPHSPETQLKIAALDKRIDGLAQQLAPFLPKARYASISLDETAGEALFEEKGAAADAEGAPPGPGKGYTWWANEPGKDTLIYKPRARGPHRIWLSWGAGFASHTSSARYLLETASGRREIAVVDQKHVAGGKGAPDNKKRWSGWHDAGVHELAPGDRLILVGGDSGTAITADRVVFEPVSGRVTDPVKKADGPAFRAAVDPLRNVETIASRPAKFVRFTIEESSSGQPCLDELEIYSAGKNVALASNGAKVSSSGDFEHPSHKLAHINDGQHGNARSWISAQAKDGWVQIELPGAMPIERIEWSRDREGKYKDRLATRYRLEVALEPDQWELVAHSHDRLELGSGPVPTGSYDFSGHPEAVVKEGKLHEQTLSSLRAERETLAAPVKAYAGRFEQPGAMHRLYRGEPDLKREVVGPGAIDVFTTLELAPNAPEAERRRAFAEWVVDPGNPMTARVMANRIWQFHFGTGIFDTPSDLGINGTKPTHPELLDWIASELIAGNWSLKNLHRVILYSRTWQQDNRPRPEGLGIDASARLLWRFPSRRLEAEGIRDAILTASGKIDLETGGGPGFSAFEVALENVRHYYPKKEYGAADWRRMIYMTKVRQEKDHVFGAFDCPDASQAVAKRSRSTTPLQALNLLNSSFVMEQADYFAKRLETDATTTTGRIGRAFDLCFQRRPSPEDLADATAFIEQEGLIQFTRAMLNANEFVFIP